MAKNLTFWSVILGFLLGYCITLSDKLVGKLSSNIPILYSFEYRALALLIPAIIGLALIFHYVEKAESEKHEHNQEIFYEAINRWSVNTGKLTDTINLLINEIKADKQRQDKDGK